MRSSRRATTGFANLLLVAGLAVQVLADCECGYSVDGIAYTEVLESDFLHITDVTQDTDWVIQNYTATAEESRGAYGKNASLDNVVSNPLANQNQWSGEGVNGGDAGLQIFVRGGIPASGYVGMGEIATERDDLLYGSYRTSMKLTSVNGTCGAFFWYFDNAQEIDMEFLSAQFNATSNPVNLVLQSEQSEQQGFNSVGTPTFQVHQLPFQPDEGFHEYRFDWTPEFVKFYADGVLLDTMRQAIPTSAGHLTLNHWSNGNKLWSEGPPPQDAIMTVSYVKSYFNSTDPDRLGSYSSRCSNPAAKNAVCQVPDQNSTASSNSSTGQTYFFSYQGNMTNNQTVYNATGGAMSLNGNGAYTLLSTTLLLSFVLLAL